MFNTRSMPVIETSKPDDRMIKDEADAAVVSAMSPTMTLQACCECHKPSKNE
jgi:hypothetical protein